MRDRKPVNMMSCARFPGVTDDEEDDSLCGTFFNDMYLLDAAKGVWHTGGRRPIDPMSSTGDQLYCYVEMWPYLKES